jgi:hypothetical protein
MTVKISCLAETHARRFLRRDYSIQSGNATWQQLAGVGFDYKHVSKYAIRRGISACPGALMALLLTIS